MTITLNIAVTEQTISIHTPARGVTRATVIIGTTKDFNPHSREGSDAYDVDKVVEQLEISIHTPARGVT